PSRAGPWERWTGGAAPKLAAALPVGVGALLNRVLALPRAAQAAFMASLAIIAGAVLIAAGGGDSAGADATRAPDLVGRSLSEAHDLAGQAGLELVEGPAKPDAIRPADLVIDQRPGAGGSIARGGAITVTASLGNVRPIPNLIGLSIDEARRRIGEADFQLTEENQEVTGGPPGLVLNQEPPPGALFPPGNGINLTVSAGRPAAPARGAPPANPAPSGALPPTNGPPPPAQANQSASPGQVKADEKKKSDEKQSERRGRDDNDRDDDRDNDGD
ncbi:MAG TPA: PASTA domain-containing protein, partial [Dehalococcoidia bacterium]|nr:PASTA domain-containing protein [Dehalococcoidia bacterium]